MVHEVDEIFKQFDTNHDGSLDEKEVHAFLDASLKKTGHTATSGDEIKQWIAKADRNGDGKISQAELYKILRGIIEKPK